MNIFRVIPVDEPSPKSLKNVFSQILPFDHMNYELPKSRIRYRMRSPRTLEILHQFGFCVQLNITFKNL